MCNLDDKFIFHDQEKIHNVFFLIMKNEIFVFF